MARCRGLWPAATTREHGVEEGLSSLADSSERWPGELVRAGHRRVRHLPRIRRRSYRSIIRVSKSGSESMSTPDDSRRGGPAGTTTTS